ncbi:hypothetical protein [Microbacterium resistens]
MIRVIGIVIWLALSAVLLLWAGIGLFGVDQRQSPLSWTGDSLGLPIMVGVAWGLLLTFGGTMMPSSRSRVRAGRAVTATGTIVDVSRTGLTVNDVPQFDIYVRVTPAQGDDVIGRLRTLVPSEEQGALQVGTPLPIAFDPANPDDLALADPEDPAVRAALLDWRIAKGLIAPEQVRARTTGIQVPASVVAVRPTGRRLQGQVELSLRVLLTPDGQEPWEADTTVFVYPQALAHLQVGAPIWAFYRREDPHTVAVTIEKEEAR